MGKSAINDINIYTFFLNLRPVPNYLELILVLALAVYIAPKINIFLEFNPKQY